jgi:hypothetical protein
MPKPSDRERYDRWHDSGDTVRTLRRLPQRASYAVNDGCMLNVVRGLALDLGRADIQVVLSVGSSAARPGACLRRI